MRKKLRNSIALIALIPTVASAAVSFSEISYDLSGTDSSREWVEVFNSSGNEVDLTQYSFREGGTNHSILHASGGHIPAGGYGIIADNTSTFLSDNPSYTGALYDSAFSLSNTGETLELILSGAVKDTATYSSSMGAAGDGDTLHYTSGSWSPGAPTPGASPTSSPSPSASEQGEIRSRSSSGGAGILAPHESNGEEVVELTVPSETFVSRQEVYRYNARRDKGIEWSFGDGTAAVGSEVTHTYYYPGTYHGHVFSDEHPEGIPFTVDVFEESYELSVLEYDGNAFARIYNGSAAAVDMTSWILAYGDGVQILPGGSVAESGGELIIKLPQVVRELRLYTPEYEQVAHFTLPSVFITSSHNYSQITEEVADAREDEVASSATYVYESEQRPDGLPLSFFFIMLFIIVALASSFVIYLVYREDEEEALPTPTQMSIIEEAKEYEIIEE